MISVNKSTILQFQNVLFKAVDPNIIVSFSDDNTTITASNISEQIFPYLLLVTNSASYNNGYMYLSDIKVYLNNDLFPTEIFGLYPIVYEKIAFSDTSAFVVGNNTNQPFINGFKNGITIGQLVDELSSLSRATPTTIGYTKKYSLSFDPMAEFTSGQIKPLPK